MACPDAVDFSLYGYRFWFEALGTIVFPHGKAGNTFRGAFGSVFRRVACVASCTGAATCERRDECAYARMFEPRLEGGPSGLADAPRPFVVRAAALDGLRFVPGQHFSMDVHVFDLREPVLAYFTRAFEELAREGLGAARAPAALRRVEVLDAAGRATLSDRPAAIVLPLAPAPRAVERLTVRFLTPTELKGGGRVVSEPAFDVLFSRIRDRISTLRELYGSGPLPIDFRAMAERAARVRLGRCDIAWERVARRSSRTGQVHPLGGFVGEVEYEGDLAEFVPYLEAAWWTGVGRQTVWGKGVVRVDQVLVRFPAG